jgi:hypothetical protein
MQNGLDIVSKTTRLELSDKIRLVQVITETEGCEVFPFFLVSQVVDNEYIVHASLVEPPDQGASYKSGTTGYNDHVVPPLS